MLIESSILYSASIAKCNLPLNLQDSDQLLFRHELTKNIPETKLLHFKNVIVTRDGVIIDNGKIINDSLLLNANHDKWINTSYSLLTRILKKQKCIDKEACVLAFNYWGMGYFHWMTEMLPRFFSVKHLLLKHTILAPSCWNTIYGYRSMLKSFISKCAKNSSTDSFYFKTINSFSPREIEPISPNSYLWVADLYMPTFTSQSGNYNEAIIVSLRNHLISHFHISKPISFKYSDKIYISRAKANRRKIVNEDAVANLLSQYGFSTIYFEDYPLKQQMSIAFNAKYLVGLHGANLTNIMFMNPSSFVFELRADGDMLNNCYFSLASALNINYLYQICERKNKNHSTQETDVSVNIKLLEKNIQLMLQ